ncbi:uncharacterized protein LOC128884248 [Hylaeus volcanicus]|uniref:uncharacterized protein LOC128884248 n=1 Tax=Hylaeus volcanicus TaxID=313075 RepID=UPI0023B7B067|nr:uncharacterized protein LOC128884248 [Hylaeus volcanicus]
MVCSRENDKKTIVYRRNAFSGSIQCVEKYSEGHIRLYLKYTKFVLSGVCKRSSDGRCKIITTICSANDQFLFQIQARSRQISPTMKVIETSSTSARYRRLTTSPRSSNNFHPAKTSSLTGATRQSGGSSDSKSTSASFDTHDTVYMHVA